VKKTLLVAAVAAMVAVPAQADVYGNIRLRIESGAELSINSSKLVVGWKGSEDIGNGLTASYKIELEHDDANTKNGVWDNDRSWVALGGDFGKVTLGREDTFDGFAAGATDVFAINGGHGFFAGNELENGIQYRGGSGAFKFGVGAELDPVVGGATNTTYGISFEGNNFQIGAHVADADINSVIGIATDINPGESATNIGGSYTFGDFTLGVTIGDDGSAVNSDVTDIVLSFPLGGCGALVGMASGDNLDAASPNGSGDVLNLGYNCKAGAAYYGFEYNDDDAELDAVAMAYYGVKF